MVYLAPLDTLDIVVHQPPLPVIMLTLIPNVTFV